ncbi:16S rRNA (uracil(1498)-N(3))-methyltransferase [Variovorax sp. J22P240]|uniref:16S rRNA (uracil(1498)-N(3))-methyltransferase n=1 Tax=Variovorax sp. J22P240 TaxID=3053514 RepID=UPI0025788AD9|nr:16S rRNA (uracil(1498)-N(3))-methyltransferase [Variovorax sp. J22P240]MDL9999180.1 16S rRNA (uracil(1498)-N(3))-methyltransferase [Variovorax sp. J22P240]
MTARFHCAVALTANSALTLPPGAARHVQVLRMQPGDALILFDGSGGEYAATVERMGRSEVAVQVGAHTTVEREAPRAVHLAVGMPANERMDWLVEKATELGVASIQPLMTAHGVLRLAGERADKKRAHWEAVAIAACEQCGRNRVPVIHPVQSLAGWLAKPVVDAERFILSLADGTRPVSDIADGASSEARNAWVLSGPEGGLSAAEEQDAIARDFVPLTLGPRVLRAETAALAALALLAGQ